METYQDKGDRICVSFHILLDNFHFRSNHHHGKFVNIDGHLMVNKFMR